jgi:hypothetical protein
METAAMGLLLPNLVLRHLGCMAKALMVLLWLNLALKRLVCMDHLPVLV